MRRLLVIASLLAASLSAAAPPLASSAAAATVGLPSVTGGYGVAPKMTFPTTKAPTTLQTEILHTGRGAKVKSGDLLIANYLGQVWRGKVFDSSFSRDATAAFPIGLGDVIKGWDEALVGQKLGSRVLLVVPPSLGYGATGNAGAGIKGTDTIVFVVDLVAQYDKTAGSRTTARVVASPPSGISITNLLGSNPVIKFAKSAAKPTALKTDVLARGTGPKTTAGMLVLQFAAYNWSGALQGSTWSSGSPDGEYVGSKLAPSDFDSLIGDTIGSRVLLEIPQTTQGGPYALVVQIGAEVPASAARS